MDYSRQSSHISAPFYNSEPALCLTHTFSLTCISDVGMFVEFQITQWCWRHAPLVAGARGRG